MILKQPHRFIIDDRLNDDDDGRRIISEVNASLERINEFRAVEITVTEHLAKSKIAWKITGYQHALLHRIVALIDGTAIAWNSRSTLTAMLAARAFMETVAIFSEFVDRVHGHYKSADLKELDELAQNWTFASRDVEWIDEYPECKSINILTLIDKFDKKGSEGFKAHYERLSERCHPNSLGHTYMFSELDRSDGTIRFSDERNPKANAHSIVTAVMMLPLVERLSTRLDKLIMQIADLQHRIHPVGSSQAKEQP